MLNEKCKEIVAIWDDKRNEADSLLTSAQFSEKSDRIVES